MLKSLPRSILTVSGCICFIRAYNIATHQENGQRNQRYLRSKVLKVEDGIHRTLLRLSRILSYE